MKKRNTHVQNAKAARSNSKFRRFKLKHHVKADARMSVIYSRSYLKNRILVQDRGGAEFQTGGILLYVEDLKRGTNPAEKGGRSKDIFEIASR
ncbi:MAG: hypothetical protein PVF79_21305 [Desulfobacterales bacterium]|jgi:hypothetical protein